MSGAPDQGAEPTPSAWPAAMWWGMALVGGHAFLFALSLLGVQRSMHSSAFEVSVPQYSATFSSDWWRSLWWGSVGLLLFQGVPQVLLIGALLVIVRLRGPRGGVGLGTARHAFMLGAVSTLSILVATAVGLLGMARFEDALASLAAAGGDHWTDAMPGLTLRYAAPGAVVGYAAGRSTPYGRRLAREVGEVGLAVLLLLCAERAGWETLSWCNAVRHP